MKVGSALTVFLAIFLIFGLGIAQAWVAKGPYVQNPTTDAISILWATDYPSQDTLEWGPDESLGNVIEDSEPARSHEHRITGLQPTTMYYYRVNAEGQTGEIKTFATATDTCSPFTFVLIGDTRSEHLTHQINTEKIIDIHPDFVLNTGDIVDSEDDPWQNEILWQVHFSVERELMDEVPLFPVAGNHDSGTEDIWARIFALPDDASSSELYYAFRYGNSLFAVVDTNQDVTVGSEQYVWLEQTLADAYDHPEVLHIFVSFHIPPYSAGEHANNQTLIDNLTPLFETYHVQAVLNGHDHNFQHMEKNGVRYFISGGGAASLHIHANPIPETVEFLYRHHYCIIDVNGAEVSLEAWGTFTGLNIYSYSWEDDMGKDPCADDDTTDDDTADDDTADDDTVDDDTSDDDQIDDDVTDDDVTDDDVTDDDYADDDVADDDDDDNDDNDDGCGC